MRGRKTPIQARWHAAKRCSLDRVCGALPMCPVPFRSSAQQHTSAPRNIQHLDADSTRMGLDWNPLRNNRKERACGRKRMRCGGRGCTRSARHRARIGSGARQARRGGRYTKLASSCGAQVIRHTGSSSAIAVTVCGFEIRQLVWDLESKIRVKSSLVLGWGEMEGTKRMARRSSGTPDPAAPWRSQPALWIQKFDCRIGKPVEWNPVGSSGRILRTDLKLRNLRHQQRHGGHRLWFGIRDPVPE